MIRDDFERALRRFNLLEETNGDPPVIDFDCAPTNEVLIPYEDRFSALDDLKRLNRLVNSGPVAEHLKSSIAYLSSLLGEHPPLIQYIADTQGCDANGWTEEYLMYRLEVAKDALDNVGIKWDEHSRHQVVQLSDTIEVEYIGTRINQYADKYANFVRNLTASKAKFHLEIENVQSDEYWSYWLDGAGNRARLRINLNNAVFTDNEAYRFALHEVLGHALQYASITDYAAQHDVPWPRLLAVHANHQVLCEGLAQILPLLAQPDNPQINAMVRLDHYLQLVRAELHVLINSGAPASSCRELAKMRAPQLESKAIARELQDRSKNPRLRSYLWAYPAGLDWFMNLYESQAILVPEVLRAAYKQPLSPSELEQFWPSGPIIGRNP